MAPLQGADGLGPIFQGFREYAPPLAILFTPVVQKNIVKVVLQEGINHYIPLVEESPAKQELGQSFLQKFFGGVLPSMVANFVNDDKITLDELTQLQEMIEKKRREMQNNKEEQP